MNAECSFSSSNGLCITFESVESLGTRVLMTNFLAIETSCDETSVAIFDDALQIRANVVASQVELHARFGGVVPEVAARAHLQRLLPTMRTALEQARLTLKDI